VNRTGYSFILFLFILASCSVLKKPLVEEEAENVYGMTTAALTDSINQALPYDKWVTQRVKLGLDMPDRNVNAYATVKWKKDSAIWASITIALGIEVARVLVRPDSIFILNRLEKTYTSRDLRYLNNYIPLGNISFDQFQNLLTGKALVPVQLNRITKNDTSGLQYSTEYYDYSGHQTFYPQYFRLMNVFLEASDGSSQLELDYKNYSKEENILLPEFIFSKARNPQPFEVEYEVVSRRISRFEKIRISVPGSYERI